MWILSKVLQLETALILTVQQVILGKITIIPHLPEESQLVRILCYSNSSRNWFHNGNFIASCNSKACLPKEDQSFGYKYTADNEKAEVTISSVDRYRDGGLWSCAAPSNFSITLDVYLQVTDVKLELKNQLVLDRSVLTFTSGEMVTMTCVHAFSTPDPTIEWHMGSQMKRSGSSHSFTFSPGNEDHDTAIYCRAYNIHPSRAVESSKPRIFVKVPVTSVKLSPSVSTIVFYERFSQSLTCTSSPSRPIPTIRWWLDSRQLTDTIVNTNTRDSNGLYTLTSNINLTLMKDDLNRQIYCDSSIDGQESVFSNKHNVDVWYEPSKPKVNHYEFPWLENGTGILQCNSSAYGNPSSSVIWNTHKGYVTTDGKLVIADLVPSDNGKEIFCKLENRFTIDKFVQVVSEPVKLNVEYHPIVSYNATSPLTLNETQAMSVMCKADGNPRPDTVQWNEWRSVLQFDSVSRQDTGNFTCVAIANSTKYGTLTGQRQLHIIVQYAPDIIVTLAGSTLLNESALFICEALGIPADNTFTAWIHVWGNVTIRTGLRGRTNRTHNRLKVDRLSLENMGTYICSANNGIKGVNGKLMQTGSETLHVKGLPIILNENSLFAGEIGQAINISIPFYSDPAIESFNIERKGTTLVNSMYTYLSDVFVDFSMYGKAVPFRAQMAYIVIRNITHEDLDSYTLVLQNPIGTTEYVYQLLEFGPPWRVHTFYFNRYFVDGQIEFHFDPGFNGGLEQWFVIEYKSARGPNNVWENTTVEDLQKSEAQQYRLINGTFSANVTQRRPGHHLYRMYSWNAKGKSPFSEIIMITIPNVNAEEKTAGNQLLVAMPFVYGVGGGTALLIVTVITLVILILRKRSSPETLPDARSSEENESPGGVVVGVFVPTGGVITSVYDSIRSSTEDDNPYLDLQEHFAAQGDLESSAEEVGRVFLQTASNNVSDNEYESPTISKAEVHSYFEPQELATELREIANYRSNIGRGILQSAAFNSTCTELSNPMNNVDEVHSYLEPQNAMEVAITVPFSDDSEDNGL